MMKRLTVHLALHILSVVIFSGLDMHLIYAQGENNNWTFGYKGGLDFNSGSPVFFESSMYSREGCATISDAFGNLIFYTSGSMVWDRNGMEMPNGNILGNGWYGSGTQAALILRSLSDPDEYYVFTLDPEEIARGVNPKLRYSVVDMKLNQGLGDVKINERNVVLDDEMEERMYAVETEDCGYWIVGHKRHSNQYVAFKLTASGISGPVYSAGSYTGYFGAGDLGEIKISPDRKKIATMFFNSSVIEIGEFDHRTGVISNAAVLDSHSVGGYWAYWGYGLSFSPDNSKLYVTVNECTELNQYDLSFYPNITAIKNSKIRIATAGYSSALFYTMRIGPDRKIYLADGVSGFIACIESPDKSGSNCEYKAQMIKVPSSAYEPLYGNFYGSGFGNETITITYKDTLPGRMIDTLVCFSDSILINVEDNLLSYTWNDGITGSSRYVQEDGIYYCLSTKECTMRMDTFKVSFVKGNLDLGSDTTICPGDSLVLQVSGNGFRWQDGSTDSVYVVSQAGRYSVSVATEGCLSSDTITVGMYNTVAGIVEHDTLICKGERMFLQGISIPAGSFNWNTSSNADTIEIEASGLYILEVENICGTFSDSVQVEVQDCDCQPFLPNAFSPNGDGTNDVFRVLFNCYPKQFVLYIYNRYGQKIFSSFDRDMGWDGTFNHYPVDVGTYYYHFQYTTPNGNSGMRSGDVVLIR